MTLGHDYGDVTTAGLKCQVVGEIFFVMADFIRGAFGVSRSSSTKERETRFEREKEKLHASPSTGSDDNADLGVEEFDPFASSQTEADDVDGYSNVSLKAPPETE